jgi:hypothetical protein
MHSPTPLKSEGVTGLSPQDTEAVTVRALATLQWLNDQARTGQPPLDKHFRDLQTSIFVLLHNMLSTYVVDVHQCLQTVCVHGLASLMECWNKYGECQSSMIFARQCCGRYLCSCPDLQPLKWIRNCRFLAFLPCGSASVSTFTELVGS